jgi:hypothetical protein
MFTPKTTILHRKVLRPFNDLDYSSRNFPDAPSGSYKRGVVEGITRAGKIPHKTHLFLFRFLPRNIGKATWKNIFLRAVFFRIMRLYNIFAGNKPNNGDTYSVKRAKGEGFTAH